MAEYGLELHLDKTKIVHCKNCDRKENYQDLSRKFDFLGYGFKPRAAQENDGGSWTGMYASDQYESQENDS